MSAQDTHLTTDDVERATESIPHDVNWTPGCDCDRRNRRRTIVDKTDVPPTNMEVWACLNCGGVYLRPNADLDYADAPDEDQTRPNSTQRGSLRGL